MEFGEWPQSEVQDVEENSLELVDGGRGYFKDNYYTDGQGNYYVKHNDDYYKVEPIKWRVLTDDYAETGKALLLAENILICEIPYYVNTSSRTISGAIVYLNNYKYSTIRTWLNGGYKSGDTQTKTYEGKGFLQTAFTKEAKDLIAPTYIDNSKESTFDSGETQEDNPYVCDDTEDKIFLLCKQEFTKEEYGFAAYDEYGKGNTRIRVITDYAKATGVYQANAIDYGGWWGLRSSLNNYEYYARIVNFDGDAINSLMVRNEDGDIVLALSISLQWNLSMNGNWL